MDTKSSLVSQISDPSIRRDQYKLLLFNSHLINISKVAIIILWLQDPWSEIRKDCSKWLKLNFKHITTEALTILFESLILCIQSGNNNGQNESYQPHSPPQQQQHTQPPWQSIHGSLLGLTELITNSIEITTCNSIQNHCLSLVGSSLHPIREASTACISKLVMSGQISTAVLISTILASMTTLYGTGMVWVIRERLFVCMYVCMYERIYVYIHVCL